MKFLDLCIEDQRKSYARQALLQFKIAVQNTSIPSIEKVLNYFIAQAEAKLTEATETARKEISALPENPLVDDDMPLQPLDMLQDAFIDSEGDRERIERRLIAPAQKFTWDAYDISLDISKGSDRLEQIYQSIAHRAFTFCKVHERKHDFRRLCEQRLRKDLANASKYAHQQHSVNLADADTLSRHLDTRFLQLETAVELELWQEAFRSVEDVHGLVAGKGSAKPSMMATYYEKLTQIFKAEGGKQTAVFHAAAWARYLQYAERAGSVPERAPGCVLLSALAVPLGEVESKQRLVALLNLPKMPTRNALVKDAAAKHLKRVPSAIQELYNIIEVDFQPLKACAALKPIINSLGPEYQPYLPALREVVLSRLFQELSQVYDSVSLSHVLDLVKAFEGTSWETDMPSLEQFLTTASRRNDVAATIDHSAKSITFAAPVVPADRLSQLAICLHNTVQYLNPAPVTSRAEAFAYAIAQAEEERKLTAQRRQIVIKRRELMEEANSRREKEQSTLKAERDRALAEENARRDKQASAAAERLIIDRQMEQAKREEARKLADLLQAQGGFKVESHNIDELDTDQVRNLHVEQLAREKKELGEKLRLVGKRVDHLERAYRKEERELLDSDYERQKTQDRESHDSTLAASREEAIASHKSERDIKNRLARMMPDYVIARQAVASQQEKEFQQAKEKAQRIIAEEKAKFRKEVIARRQAEKRAEEEDRLAYEQEEKERAGKYSIQVLGSVMSELMYVTDAEAKAAAEETARAEEEAKAREEIEARQREADAKVAEARAEREARRAADLEQIRKQQERQDEAERRRAERQSGGGLRRTDPAPVPVTSAAVPGSAPPVGGATGLGAGSGAPPQIVPKAGGGGGWREKEAARKAAAAAGGAGGDQAPSSPSVAPTRPQSQSQAPPSNGPPAARTHDESTPAPTRGGTWTRGMSGRGRGGGGAGTPPASTRGTSRW